MHSPTFVRRLGAGTLILLVAASGVYADELSNMWRNAKYEGPPVKSAFVLAERKDPLSRRLWEDAFVQQLARHGVAATASYTVYPDQLPDTSAVRSYVGQKGYDALILTYREGRETVTKYTAGYVETEPRTLFRPMWGTYVTYYQGVYVPGYAETTTVVNVGTEMWRSGGDDGGTLVWMGSSRGVDPSSPAHFSHEVAERVTSELNKAHLIP
jgi:hypothetical protein